MKKNKNDEDMRSEYTKEELGKGMRGKFYKEFSSGTNLILLSPDVAEVFQNEKAVNDALRSLIKIARDSAAQSKEIR